MIEQVGRPLSFRFPYTNNGVSKTGLTVTADVYNPAGTLIATDGLCTEVGGGWYQYTLSAGLVLTVGLYTAVGKVVSTAVDRQHVHAGYMVGMPWIERVDAAISSIAADILLRVSQPMLRSRSKITLDYDVEVVQGNTYSVAANQTIPFSSTSWPDLTNAEVKMKILDDMYDTEIVTSGMNVLQEVRQDFTAAETKLMQISTTKYSVTATLADGVTVVTLSNGLFIVKHDTEV